jgi:hypothetical protein
MAFRPSYDPKVSNFRIMSRKVVDAHSLMREESRNLGAQIHWLGFRVGYLDVQHDSRHSGETSYSSMRLIALALDVALSYSNKPLYFAIGAGLAMSLVSAVFATWFLIRNLFWKIPVEGWASLMVSLWFLGGFILANMGVIGIYIGKIYTEGEKRPVYVVAERVNC